MGSMLTDKRDVEFVLYEQFDVLQLTAKEKFEYFSRDEFDMVLEQALVFAENVLAPSNEEGDRVGAKWNDGNVTIPEVYHKPLRMYGENGWVAACEDPDVGGQGLPFSVFTACNEMFHAANTALNLYPGLAHGTAVMINHHGTDEQKEKYLEKLLSFEWGSTMNLTEPGAGSDLARVSTKAIPREDGLYNIVGQKIFITAGDQDAHPNILHPVLARIEGDPEGIKGISIFLVPKYRLNEDGSLGDWNDVTVAGIEHKMGIRGSATCQMSYGDNGDCVGEILGKPGQGLAIMFLLMNEERLNVGVQSVGLSSAAYLNALAYARERYQGVDVSMKGKSTDMVTIVNHPDVRRNLLSMKGQTEGLRALNYYTSFLIDTMNAETDPEKKKEIFGFVDLLTPLCKAYSSIRGGEITSNAVNVFGGYGYCQDYPVEQHMRDQKITALYEGTNAIHSIDLFGRKMRMKDGRFYHELLDRIKETIDRANEKPGLKDYAQLVVSARGKLEEVTGALNDRLDKGGIKETYQDLLPYLELTGDVIMGWMHLWQLIIAEEKLAEHKKGHPGMDDNQLAEEDKNAAFYMGKVYSSRYYIKKILPLVQSRGDCIVNDDFSPVEVPDVSLGEL